MSLSKKTNQNENERIQRKEIWEYNIYNIIPKEKWIGTQTREYQTQAKSPMTHSTQFFAQIPTKSL